MQNSNSPFAVIIAALNFEKDLERELQFAKMMILAKKGRFYMVDSLKVEPIMAQNIWYNPLWIDIDSVGQAAAKLKELAPVWSLHSIAHHRRAELIEEKILSIKKKPVVFPMRKKLPPLAAWTMWEPLKLIAARVLEAPTATASLTFLKWKRPPRLILSFGNG